MISRQDLTPDMLVYSRDNRRLGRILQIGESEFVVEKGGHFPKDTAVAFGDVGEILGGVVYLIRDADFFAPVEPIRFDPDLDLHRHP